MLHVLIIEDEALHGFHLADLVEEVGKMSVAFAASEKQALSEARERRPDIIVCDVHLREGRGPSAAQAIREELGEIPVIFITASPEECDGLEYAAAVLVKPIHDRQFVATFRHFAARQ